MKQGLNRSEFNSKLEYIAANREDRIIESEDLEYTNGQFWCGDSSFKLTHHALDQVASYYGIPRAAMQRYDNQTRYGDNWNNIVNEEIQNKPGPRLLRVLDGQVEGFVSTRFNVGWDAHRTFPQLIEAMDTVGMRLASGDVTQTHTYVKALQDTGEFKALGNVMKIGLSVRTSDYGLAKHTASLFLMTLTCLNGMMVSSVECSLSRTHRGKNMWQQDSDDEYEVDQAQINEAMCNLGRDMMLLMDNDRIKNIKNTIERAGVKRVTKDEKKLQKIAKKYGITGFGEFDLLKKHLDQSGDYTAWGLSSAVTRASQDVSNYDRASALETIGWNILHNSSILDMVIVDEETPLEGLS